MPPKIAYRAIDAGGFDTTGMIVAPGLSCGRRTIVTDRLFDAGFAARHWPKEYGGQARPIEEEVVVASTIADY